jgi:hypothetical protein
MHFRTPGGIGEIDLQRRTNVRQAGMRAPCLDALQVALVEIARPPRDVRRTCCEMNDMLAGAATGLHHVTGFACEEFFQHGPDRLVVTVKRRRVETAVSFNRPAILAELHHKLSHLNLASTALPDGHA